MGLLSAVGGFITGNTEGSNKFLDAGMKALDAAVYTEEEKATAKADHFDKWSKLQMALLEKDTGTSVNRRRIGWFIVLSVLLNFQICVVMSLLGKNDSVAEIITLSDTFKVGWAFVSVIIFYFGDHMIKSFKGK